MSKIIKDCCNERRDVVRIQHFTILVISLYIYVL